MNENGRNVPRGTFLKHFCPRAKISVTPTAMPLPKIFFTFLQFGFLAWGGPVAQLALIREELVEKKKWLSAEKFKKSLAIYQLLPGPEAHEMCVHIGTMKAGRMGGMLAGLGFMLPGFLLMLLAAFTYQTFGRAYLAPLFLFTTPVVAALILRATHRLSTHLVKTYQSLVPLAAAVFLTLLSVNFLAIFCLAALWEILISRKQKTLAIGLCSALALVAALIPQHPLSIEFASNSIFISGLKGGLTSFGGAYTAIPLLEQDMVGRYPGITREVFLDSFAIGSLIPSPLIIFSTFLGYVAEGMSGAALITLGIFLPAFSFSLLGFRLLEKLTENETLHNILEGIAAAVVGLLLVTAANIILSSLTSLAALALFTVSLFLFYRYKQTWLTPALVICAALAGLVVRQI